MLSGSTCRKLGSPLVYLWITWPSLVPSTLISLLECVSFPTVSCQMLDCRTCITVHITTQRNSHSRKSRFCKVPWRSSSERNSEPHSVTFRDVGNVRILFPFFSFPCVMWETWNQTHASSLLFEKHHNLLQWCIPIFGSLLDWTDDHGRKVSVSVKISRSLLCFTQEFPSRILVARTSNSRFCKLIGRPLCPQIRNCLWQVRFVSVKAERPNHPSASGGGGQPVWWGGAGGEGPPRQRRCRRDSTTPRRLRRARPKNRLFGRLATTDVKVVHKEVDAGGSILPINLQRPVKRNEPH